MTIPCILLMYIRFFVYFSLHLFVSLGDYMVSRKRFGRPVRRMLERKKSEEHIKYSYSSENKVNERKRKNYYRYWYRYSTKKDVDTAGSIKSAVLLNEYIQLPILRVVSLTELSLSSFAPQYFVSRDRLGSLVSRDHILTFVKPSEHAHLYD